MARGRLRVIPSGATLRTLSFGVNAQSVGAKRQGTLEYLFQHELRALCG
jgi:hypothetical protein